MLEIWLLGNSSKVSVANEIHVSGQWEKDNLCYKTTKSAAGQCFSVL